MTWSCSCLRRNTASTSLQGIKTYTFAAPLGKDSEICPMPHKAGQYASFDFEVREGGPLLSALKLTFQLHSR